ncbi:DNA alkylation repair protein [Leptospira kirschneri]|uniref:DNA alkylation repair protein n=1 Tax=Leptospira kirschneri TaxID=29507 RepID=UPI0002785D3C|nr:DNA alkylation repair protein [Leptospira kirschneri]EJO71599.1 DNA alkylation repair enzyme [Leptospira kirschneri serovar Grippotyphosa str. RM52]EKR08315.1 DNA alkylation repair enzyme [Leptospira kirschneri serovar Valbuzzi str. 200702274]EMJ86147.1 DNA alkylation repair enzyme [Leptospira kirschneri str. JB]EMK04071.1 DNA alkylation repair enzyme [Leptospira kirschneri str. MMD1493]WBF95518.1 DNA alkylation repair protein [Leptospira kirschneri]
MTIEQIMKDLEKMGTPSVKKIFINHGAKEPLFGVKIADLKKIQKKIKKNNEISLELYKTLNADAMYLAGLIADEKKIQKKDLQFWVKNSTSPMISEYTIAWIAAESKHGLELAREWIESEKESISSSGWNTFSSLLSILPNDQIDSKEISKLLKRVESKIHKSQNRVKYCMNGFVIAVGGFYPPLFKEALEVAKKIGKVEVMMGETACKVPNAPETILKIEKMGKIGNKKKTARC